MAEGIEPLGTIGRPRFQMGAWRERPLHEVKSVILRFRHRIIERQCDRPDSLVSLVEGASREIALRAESQALLQLLHCGRLCRRIASGHVRPCRAAEQMTRKSQVRGDSSSPASDFAGQGQRRLGEVVVWNLPVSQWVSPCAQPDSDS